MIYLDIGQVLFLHDQLFRETGGIRGVRDIGLLESALARPQATFAAEDLYPDVFSKAAALLESLLLNHPFVDGNKRVSISAVGLFLSLNGLSMTATQDEIVAFTLHVAQHKPTVSESASWLATHSVSLE